MISLLIDNLSHDDCFDAAVLALRLCHLLQSLPPGGDHDFAVSAVTPTSRDHQERRCLSSFTRRAFYKILPWHDKTLDVGDIRILPFVQLRVGKWWIMDLIKNHLARNPSSDPDAHLFGYFSSKSKSFRPLTKNADITRVNKVWSTFGYPHITGHSHRIGGASLMLNLGFEIKFIRIMAAGSLFLMPFTCNCSQFPPSLASNPLVIKDLAILEQSYLDTFQQSSSFKGRDVAKKVAAAQSRFIKERKLATVKNDAAHFRLGAGRASFG
ncbi:hypothetical protein BT69DRAFT_1352207 [Atractiella rhizophila]|nr:hypothetical protein BT69DRAFT_1352207 [Atractiella rhizophila]